MENTVTENYYKFQLEERDQTIMRLSEDIRQKKMEVEQKDRQIATLESQVQALSNGGPEDSKNEKNMNNKTENQKVENNRTEHHQDNNNSNIKNPDGSINMEEATKLVEMINQKKEEVSKLENQLKGEINEEGKF